MSHVGLSEHGNTLGKSHLLLGGGGGAVTFSCGRQKF